MRKDMANVITDEPRKGGRYKDRKGRKRAESRIPDDEKPVKEAGSLRRRWISHWFDHKEFGDHTSPLRRFALSCEGRHWDEVYSEICNILKKGNVVQNHVFTHLYQYIERNVIIKDGVPCSGEYPFSPLTSQYGSVVYVHPETKILTRTPEKKRTRWKKKLSSMVPIETGWIDKNTFFMKDGQGIWYGCWLKEVPGPRKEPRITLDGGIVFRNVWPYVYDNFLKMQVLANSNTLQYTYHRPGVYCYKKLQLNKREIRRIKKFLEKK